MAGVDKQTIKKVCDLLDVARGLYERMGATLDEVEQILGGGVGIGSRLKAIEEGFGVQV